MIGIILFILERGCPFWKLPQIHIKEVHRELAVEVAQLVLPVVCLWKVFGKFFQIPPVIGAVVVNAFVDTEVFPVFDWL